MGRRQSLQVGRHLQSGLFEAWLPVPQLSGDPAAPRVRPWQEITPEIRVRPCSSGGCWEIHFEISMVKQVGAGETSMAPRVHGSLVIELDLPRFAASGMFKFWPKARGPWEGVAGLDELNVS